MKILLIEDNPVTGEALAELLRGRGHEVAWSGNGLAALTRLEAPGGVPDVLVLDLLMPGLDGVSFLHQLRRHPRLALLPVVAVTAAADAQVEQFEEQLQHAKPCKGVVGDCPVQPVKLLRKPFELPDLEEALAAVTAQTAELHHKGHEDHEGRQEE